MVGVKLADETARLGEEIKGILVAVGPGDAVSPSS